MLNSWVKSKTLALARLNYNVLPFQAVGMPDLKKKEDAREEKMESFTLDHAVQIEAEILSGRSTLDDILSLYKFYCEKNDTLNQHRIFMYLKNKTLPSKKTPLLIYYGTPNVKISDENTIVYINEEIFSPEKSFDIITLYDILSLSSITDVYCTKKFSETLPFVVDIIKDFCHDLKKSFYDAGNPQEREKVERERAFTASSSEAIELLKEKLLLPTEIIIPTIRGKCNIKCRFCEQAFLPIHYQEVSTEIFEQALRVIPQKFIKTILTPYLEPLASDRYLEKYLKRSLELRPDLNIGINTNGSHLTKEIAAKLVDWQLKYIVISMNLCDRESYIRFTGKDFFDRVCEGVKFLHAERHRRRSEWPKIIVQFLNIPPVLGKEEELRNYWLHYADSVFFRNVSLPTALPGRVRKMKEELGAGLLDYEISLPPGWPCMSMFSTCAINYDGNYTPCCGGMRATATATTAQEKIFVSPLVIGNIFDEDIATVWQGKNLRRARAMQIAGLLPICNTCRMNQSSYPMLLSHRNAFYSYYYEGKD